MKNIETKTDQDLNSLLNKQELRSQLITYVHNRIRLVHGVHGADEYEYTHKLGRIHELEELLVFCDTLRSAE